MDRLTCAIVSVAAELCVLTELLAFPCGCGNHLCLFRCIPVPGREKPVLLQSPDKMVDTQYEELLQAVLQTAAVLQLEDIHDCVHSLQPPPDLSTVDR